MNLKQGCLSISLAFLPVTGSYADQSEERIAELESQLEFSLDMIQELATKVESLEHAVNQQSIPAVPSEEQIDRLATQFVEATDQVDLSVREFSSIDSAAQRGADDGHVLSNPWWRNFDISGFAGSGYYDTGSSGTRPHGNFEIKEASLFVEADIWENMSFFLELQTNRLGKDDSLFARTGEVYLHFRDVFEADDLSIGAKIGRIDIPFGEEYLSQDSIDNPLITTSAVYPYGWDEGVLLYGNYRPINWIFALTDGTDKRSFEESSDKAVNIKVYGSPTQNTYLSASWMRNGEASKTAFEFGGSHFQPIGASHASTLGVSPSELIDSDLIQVDGKYDFTVFAKSGYVAGSLGTARQDDVGSQFDRDLQWFSIESFLALSSNWYTALRLSQIETDDNDLGYHFDGKIYAGGNGAFGYDAQQFRRFGLGLGWTPNPNLTVKLEIGKDSFDLIDSSPFSGAEGGRNFIGLEVVSGF